MIGILPSMIGAAAGIEIAGTNLPVAPDGTITFDHTLDGSEVAGQYITFTFTLDSASVPDVV